MPGATMDRTDELLLDHVVQAGSAAHPGVAVPREAFAAFLAERAPSTTAGQEWIATVHIADLYLACACVLGLEPAIVIFEAEHVIPAGRALRRMGYEPLVIDDILGSLREKLFFLEEGRRSLLHGYSGRGELSHWLRSVAVRLALRAAGPHRHDPIDEDAERIAVPADSPELEYLKAAFAAAFKAALGEAIDALAPRDKNLLRQYFLDELTLEEVGRLHGVHAATASRWLAQVRQEVFTKVTRTLMRSLQLREEELRSVLRTAQSRLDMSIRHLLRTTP